MALGYIELLLKGLLIGFAVSLPLGPVGIIGIQRTLSEGRLAGFITGLGSATADALFAIIAIFALSYVSPFIDSYSNWIKGLGGIMVVLIGISIYTKKLKRPSVLKERGGSSKTGHYFSTFALTAANPAYLALFLMLFAVAGVGENINIWGGVILIAGVFVGAMGCWILLSWSVDKLRRKFSMRSLWWMNRISGVIIIILGAGAIVWLVIGITNLK